MFTPRVSTPTSSAPKPFGQLRRENSTIDPEECPEGDFLQPEDHYLEIGNFDALKMSQITLIL